MTTSPSSTLFDVETDPVKFLIVDDDQVSVMAIKRALKKLRILNPILVARDGREALDILRGASGEDGLPPPFLVTLDLNMPRMNGFEFLEELRQDKSLNRAVVFVLSTSDAPTDIAHAYDSNVAGYIVKDDLGDSFLRALDMIDSFSKVVELPR
ncbi:DNA-binding response regulator [Roseovarius faecimaris]|uniref:DNA-binding response regulator n=1 Tax=Roseovarius faecimaris TaxID=2494550 RepID=A0A6I6IRJ5_9RHOB|nr:response regulator [Roseovarius faecimaris]QGX98503.1 DNA-binding response regulator [Roseovarius faecimaris]